jgi:hypothetical protein
MEALKFIKYAKTYARQAHAKTKMRDLPVSPKEAVDLKLLLVCFAYVSQTCFEEGKPRLSKKIVLLF